MKSDGTRRAIIIAVLCLFSIAMLFMTASAWGLKAFARFAEFMTGDRIFLRILAGIGFSCLIGWGRSFRSGCFRACLHSKDRQNRQLEVKSEHAFGRAERNDLYQQQCG